MQHCVDIRGMPPQKFNLLLTKMRQDGYNFPSNCQDVWTEWRWVGVNTHGDIVLHNNHIHYQDFEEDPFWNVLNDKWLEEYLK